MNLELPRAGLGVGVFFIAFAVVAAAAIIGGAKDAQSPVLFMCLFGGIFSIVPGALGIGIIVNHRRIRRN